jgi:cbb3-type cytochrome oxidase subunit 3
MIIINRPELIIVAVLGYGLVGYLAYLMWKEQKKEKDESIRTNE